MLDILYSVLLGFASLFFNPVFYLLVIGLFLFSAQRVRRERRSFNVKAYGMFNTIFTSVAPSLIMGVCGSALLLAAGVSLPAGMIVLLSCGYLVTMLTTQLRFLSPAVAGGLAIIAAYFFPDINTSSALANQWISDIRSANFFSLGLFLTAGLLIEYLLVYFWGARQSSPRLISSRRGSKVGAHEASEIWIVPLFLLVPSAGPIHALGPWPFVPDVGTSFSLALFPLGVGIAQLITHTLPKPAVRHTGQWLLVTALITAVLVGLSYPLRLPFLVLIGAAFALCSRIALIWYHHYLRKERPYYFIEPNRGLRVVGVIPGSLGDRIGIKPGQEVLRVNGRDVSSEYEFYNALQTQTAYCKIEVVNRFGEPWFARGTIHETDDHKIGLLFLEPEKWNRYTKTKV
ncbi:PDZ domain-containing protein [Sporolactobacillus sp. THM7-7]|nr:PDZ domain-containing protein [Sporolactobacillus sp. THM7-7]